MISLFCFCLFNVLIHVKFHFNPKGFAFSCLSSAAAMQSPSLSEASSSLSLDDQDEGVRIAVRALGAMRNSGGISQPQSSINNSMTCAFIPYLSIRFCLIVVVDDDIDEYILFLAYQPTPALSIASSSTSTSLPSPSPSVQEDVNSPDFVSRVSHLPLVNTALRAYEHGKASSRVVKVSKPPFGYSYSSFFFLSHRRVIRSFSTALKWWNLRSRQSRDPSLNDCL